uniref:Uncharacterized protein n=1 Tax=Vitrella brassicaformis TaxID=1169539 RepID=A0A7S1P5K1_9ALVE
MAPRRAAGETAAARARTERLRRRSLLVGKVCESIDTGDAGSNRESEAAAPAAPALVKPPPILPILPPSRPLATNSNEATNISGRTRQAAKSGAGADSGRPPLPFSHYHQYGLGQVAGGSFGGFGTGLGVGVSASAYQPLLSSPYAYASFGQPAFVQPQPRTMAPSYKASSSKQPSTVHANANGVSASPAAASSSSACPGYRPFFPPLQLPPSNPHTRHTGIGGNKPQIATSTMVATSAAAAAAASSAVDCQWQQAKGDLSGKGLARPTSRGGGSGVAMGEASKAHAVGGTVGDGTRTRSGYRNDVPASLFGGYAPIMPRAGIPNPGPVTRASHIRYAQQLPNGYPYQLRQHPQAVTLWGQWPAGAATAREVPVAHPHSHPNPHPQHHHPQPFPAIAQVLPQATASVMGGGGGIAESAMQRLLMAQMYPQHHLNTRHR